MPIHIDYLWNGKRKSIDSDGSGIDVDSLREPFDPDSVPVEIHEFIRDNDPPKKNETADEKTLRERRASFFARVLVAENGRCDTEMIHILADLIRYEDSALETYCRQEYPDLAGIPRGIQILAIIRCLKPAPSALLAAIRLAEDLSPGQLWARSIVLTFLVAITGPLIYVLFNTVLLLIDKIYPGNHLFWTGHTVWIIAALALILLSAKKLGASTEDFISTVIVGAVIFFVVLGLVVVLTPFNFPGFPSRYEGFYEWQSEETHEDIYLEESNFHTNFLFQSGPEIEQFIKERGRQSEFVGFAGFLFWQTGVSSGYIPDFSIPSYNQAGSPYDESASWGDRFLWRSELFFTVGPLVIVEKILTASTHQFPVFLVTLLLWYAIKRTHYWFR